LLSESSKRDVALVPPEHLHICPRDLIERQTPTSGARCGKCFHQAATRAHLLIASTELLTAACAAQAELLHVSMNPQIWFYMYLKTSNSS